MIHLSIRSGVPEMLSLDQFKSLPLDELAALWREYVAAMAELLPHARSDPGCPAVARVVQLAKEVRVVVSSLMAANPKNWSTLRAVKMDPGGAAPVMETPPPKWWRRVYRAMKLTSS
ncbi:hypothetical protein WJX75_006573 [Coccomyxa subellipsoidea]|uniref:Uncharacterized protein n=1 Tax=Coccomyxa subellipsoidea TaxID=248742 RepID=A0ABR2Z110_9CHLO